MGWWWVLTDKLGPLSVALYRCELNQTMGSECIYRRKSLTTQCQQYRMLLPEATRCQNLTMVVPILLGYHWWLNESCSCISKVICSQIILWYCIQVWEAFCAKQWQFQHCCSMFATVLTGLDFLSLTHFLNLDNIFLLFASIYVNFVDIII